MVSPQWMKKSGRVACMARYVVSPSSCSLIPQPCPQVSPDQTKDVGAGWIAAVENVTRSASPGVPSVDVNEMSASY